MAQPHTIENNGRAASPALDSDLWARSDSD